MGPRTPDSQPAYSGYKEIKRSNTTLEKNSNTAAQGLASHYSLSYSSLFVILGITTDS